MSYQVDYNKVFSKNPFHQKGILILDCSSKVELNFLNEKILGDLCSRYNKNLFYHKVDLNLEKAVAKKYYISQDPTWLIFNNGILIDRLAENVDFCKLHNLLKEYLDSVERKRFKSNH